MGNSVNFRNSDRVTAHVDYVESIDSAVCGKHTVLTLDQRVLVCIDLHLC